MRERARAFAPGSIGNVGPGLDILGLAVAGPGDAVEVRWNDGPRTVVEEAGHPDLPGDPARNTAAIAAMAVLRLTGARHGLRIRVTKGLPLSGGQGGSAASAVAGAVAADALGETGLDHRALLACCLEAEAQVAGRHLDNIAPSLLGGFVLVRGTDPVDVVALPVPDDLGVVLVQPEQRLRTRDARNALPEQVSRRVALEQAANIAAMVAAACLGDVDLLGRAMHDQIAEPARGPLLPGFVDARRAALAAGALGCSISGAGPTAFALTAGLAVRDRVAEAMVGAYAAAGMPARGIVTTVDREGARLA